jgi:hypothetical protein
MDGRVEHEISCDKQRALRYNECDVGGPQFQPRLPRGTTLVPKRPFRTNPVMHRCIKVSTTTTFGTHEQPQIE